MNALSIYALVAGGWLTVNGLLHDIFILASPKGKIYDRDLLRLLMDGHILITCGVIILFCAKGINENQQLAGIMALISSISILIYCGMIFPFLKSIGTILICTGFAGFIIWQFFVKS
jgi:hypothetical protein